MAGDNAKEAEYTAAARNLAESINTHLWSEDKQAYIDCIHADGRQSAIFSMQSQVVALLCGIPEGDRKAELERMLLTPPQDFVPIGSPFMSFFYYEALVQAGLYETMVEDIRKQFGEMLDYEATTCWEMYPKKKNGRTDEHNLTRSHCHAWSAAPGYFLGAVVLGVRSAAPGWRKVIVEPNPCGLTWARGSVPLPEEGRVDVFWKAGADGKLHLQVWVPENVEVEARLPDGVEGTIEVHRQSRRP
ncbi:trehalase family glycosidase [Paenibacillus sp. CC-CFT747]|nr:trehalase family glycosidase [Paenibacillus sp. CC-CFT747]